MVTGGERPRWWVRLFGPVDIASLVCFRIFFGVLMLVEVFRYLPRIPRYYFEPEFHFTYFGFDWVQPWPAEWMYVHFGVMGLAAVLVTIGLFYRAAAAVFFVGLSYVFLVEQARYLNHIYLLCLISFLMIFIPAHRARRFDLPRSVPLSADGGVIRLLDPAGQEVDRVTYTRRQAARRRGAITF